MNYKIESIELFVPVGVHVDDMRRKAVVAAIEHDCAVVFVHNDIRYDVTAENLITQVKKVG